VRRRILSFALAVVLAVLGTAGVAVYVRNANNRALAGLKTTTVLVAVKPIPAGTSAVEALRVGWLSRQRLPMSSVPSLAVAAVRQGLASLVMSADVPPGQVLLQPMLVSQVGSGTLAPPPGKSLVTIQLCLSEAVAGYVRPGSWVTVYNSYTKSGNFSGQSGCSGSQQQQLGVHTIPVPLLASIQVLGIGPPPQSGQQGRSVVTQPTTAPANSSTVLVTFAADQAQAAQLISLSMGGVPYLALLNSTQPGLASSPSLAKP
jgi:pilus assembly protein CpaB